jgi:glutamate racemase
VAELAEPLRGAAVDTVVLGCTHYAFAAAALARAFGPEVRLVDSGEAIARRAEHLLRQAALLAGGEEGSLELFTSGDPERVRRVVERLWGHPVGVRPLALAMPAKGVP